MRRLGRIVRDSHHQLVGSKRTASGGNGQSGLPQDGATLAIIRSRELSGAEKYHETLEVLKEALKAAETDGNRDALQVELRRIYLILGDHESLLATDQEYDALEPGSDPYRALNFIQSELNSISRNLQMEGPLKSATSLYQKFRPLLSTEPVSEFVPRILYYCLEIQYFWRLYGEGIAGPLIDCEQDLLRDLLRQLTEAHLVYEALELAEYLVEEPKPVLEAMAVLLAKKDREAASVCMLRQAKICAELEKHQDARNALKQARKYGCNTEKAQLYDEMLVKRFLDSRGGLLERIERLERISGILLGSGNYDAAMQSLEYAAELVPLLLNFSQAAAVGGRIHNALKVACNRSGDALSGIMFKFRHCDLRNAYGESQIEAVEQRQRLLYSHECTKLPYLRRFHKRQWMEYYILRQRDRALLEAEQYLEYCKCYRAEEEASIAENMLIQTMLQPQRESAEKRLEMLESVSTRLDRGIVADESHGWYRAQLEKQMLLVEVINELGRLQGSEMEGIVVAAAEILERAAVISRKAKLKAENAYIRHEIVFLRGAASLHLERPPEPADFDAELQAVGESGNLTEGEVRLGFDRAFLLQQLISAIHNESLPIFEALLKGLHEKERKFASQGNTAGHAAVLGTKAMVFHLIMEFDTPTIHQFRKAAGIGTLVQGAEMALDIFAETFDLVEKLERGTENSKDKTADKLYALAKFQSYFTGEVEQLYFDIALEIVVGLGDSAQTWKWIQRRKARGMSKMLRKLFPTDNSNSAPEHLGSHSALAFEDLKWVQSASTAKLIFVDWVTFGTCPPRLLFFSFRTDQKNSGAITTMVEIDVSLEDLNESMERINEARMDDPDAERYLRPLIPVVQPIKDCSSPGDILLLSPTTPLHNAPLHAVCVGSVVLIQRNPVAYVPSHAALVSCLQRLSAPESGHTPAWKAAVFAAYDDASTEAATEAERHYIYSTVEELGRRLGAANATMGEELTADRFKQDASCASVLHFHGHGISDAHAPAQQSLALGSPTQRLTMTGITSLDLGGGTGGCGAHATLITCSGGVQDFSLSGDEPLGLLSSFLLGGATSVVGALWPIQSSTGRLFTQLFYNYFLDHVDRTELGPIVNLARALQHSVLKIMENKDTRRHYHWAPFVLYGVWFCRRKPGSW